MFDSRRHIPRLHVCSTPQLSRQCNSPSFFLYPPILPSTLCEEQWKKYPQMKINKKERIGDYDQIEAFKNFRSLIEAVAG